jgi:hypothetical protein
MRSSQQTTQTVEPAAAPQQTAAQGKYQLSPEERLNLLRLLYEPTKMPAWSGWRQLFPNAFLL